MKFSSEPNIISKISKVCNNFPKIVFKKISFDIIRTIFRNDRKSVGCPDILFVYLILENGNFVKLEFLIQLNNSNYIESVFSHNSFENLLAQQPIENLEEYCHFEYFNAFAIISREVVKFVKNLYDTVYISDNNIE